MPRKTKDDATVLEGTAPLAKPATAPRKRSTKQADSTPASSESSMTEVVFQLPAHDGVGQIALVGDFNGWSQEAHPMTRQDGRFEVSVPLERGRRYRYRYLIDGHRWENDWNADEYEPNEYGGDDSVKVVG
jgi:1,4-alpha-glucan branching enzyme